MAAGHFRMRLDLVWRPLLLLFGGLQSNSFVDVTDEVVHFHFGFLFDRTVARSEIVSVSRRDWPFFMGIGWRSNLRGMVALIGSYENVVEVKVRTKQRLLGPMRWDRIAVSLEDPDRFVAELSNGAQTTESASSKKHRQAPARRSSRRQSPRQ